MNNIVNISDGDPRNRGTLEDEARSWLVRLDGSELSREERIKFQRWLVKNPQNQEAFNLAASVWNDLELLSTVLSPLASDPLPENGQPGQSFVRPIWVGLVLVIGIVSTLFYYQNYYLQGNALKNNYSDEYITAVGEQRSISLPDGSSIQMNTDSRINILYNDKSRVIHMSEGEAWFEVQHDPKKPFIVYAGRFAVRAVGTAFMVKLEGNGGLGVTVTDGRVEVASLKKIVTQQSLPDIEYMNDATYRIPVVVGQHMELDDKLEAFVDKIELVQQIDPLQIEKNLSWRDGILIFDNDPLEKVVAEINRYSPVKIVISESNIRDLRFGGYIQISNITSILATLEKNYGIKAEEINSNLIYLSRQQNQ